MTVTADFDFNPRSIVSGQSIHLYDKTLCTGEVAVSYTWYIGSDATPAVGTSLGNDPYPVITPAAGSGTRYLKLRVVGSDGGTGDKVIAFTTLASGSAKPSFTTYGDISIFVYNSDYATVINRNVSTNNNLLFTKLSFTSTISKIGTASFTVVNLGSATAIEKDLLLAGSALVGKKDNLVAIIQDKSVVWSGKILRSTQVKTGIYDNPLVQTWDIDCESDISRMKYQNVKTANKADYTLPVCQVVTELTENAITNPVYGPDINWNGGSDLGLRSSEGVAVEYTVGDSDMQTQFNSLVYNTDFDWRTRLVFYRYSYTTSSTVTYSISPLTSTTNLFLSRWVLFCYDNGIISYGKCTYNGGTSIVVGSSFTNYTLAPSSGTLIVIGDPVVDVLGDLSQPSSVTTFRVNSQPSASYSTGYGFNDKTDRSSLATKVIVKGKSNGRTITSSVAAVTPWDHERSTFEETTVISQKTEGTVLSTEVSSDPVYGGLYFTLDGWNYILSLGDYFAFITNDNTFIQASALTRILDTPVETYYGSRKVTRFWITSSTTYEPGASVDPGWQAFGIKSSDYHVVGTDNYGSIYVKSLTDINYVDAMSIYINGETIVTVDDVADTTYGPRLRYLINGTSGHRDKDSSYTSAHGLGAMVWRSAAYDETLSQAENVGSPAAYHGLILRTYASDQEVSPQTLEMYATMHVVADSYYYRKAEFWCLVYDWYKYDIRPLELSTQMFIQPGDTILCLQNDDDSATDVIYGQYKNIWQVVSMTFDSSTMIVKAELGDFERNVFTLLADKTAAINQTIT